MSGVYILVLHGDTSEPYETYPTVELLRAFTTYPTKGDVYYALKERFPNVAGVVKFANRDCHSFDRFLSVEPNKYDYYGSYYHWEVFKVGYQHD